MDNILIREIPFNDGIIELRSSIKTNLNLKSNYVLVNKEIIKSKINNSILTEDIGIKSSEFALTIISALVLVIISGIIMYFSWRI